MKPGQILHWAHFGIRLAVGLDGPYVLLAAITHRCNLRCRYCGVWNESGHEMDTRQWASLLDEAWAMGTVSVSFCGGEPLVREDLGELVARASGLGLRTSLTTNGWFVRERGDELQHLDAITVSIDGPEEIHDDIRGDGSYGRAMDAIEWGIENRKRVHTVTVLNRRNIDTIEHTCILLHRMGALPFIQPATPYIFSGEAPEEWAVDMERLSQTAGVLMRIRDDGVALGNSDAYLLMLGTAPDFRREPPCSAGRRFLTVFPDGRLVPCHITAGEDAPRYREGEFADAWGRVEEVRCDGCAIAPYFEYDAALRRPSIERVRHAWKVLVSPVGRVRSTE